MNLTNEVEECCVHIESHKISDRKKYCDRLSSLLENEEVIAFLNEGSTVSWKQVISSVQDCLRRDADKIVEDLKKKGSSNAKYPSAELFIQVIKTAVRGAPDDINISKLVGYIIGCMKDSRMKKCYDAMLLLVLKDYILLNANCRGRIASADWAELFRFLKKLCEERTLETLVLKCLMLVVKWGPASGLPPCLLREQFEFFTKLCLGISKNSPSNQQEDVLDISFDFCRNTAKDNRVSCCKFGEDIISNFVDLYELNGREARIKEQLVKFFLLQVSIHQPNGVVEGHPCAYAFSWSIWRKCLKLIYCLLNKEITFYFKYHQKNCSFFITKGNSTILLEDFALLFVEVSRQMFANPDLDVSMSVDSIISEGSQKRQRVEVTLQKYVNDIQSTKSWFWIYIVQCIIRAYPELLYWEDYLNLLQTLSSIQIESNDHNVIVNTYSCLSVMLDIADKVAIEDCKSEVEKLWKVIGESTLRAFGLNQHKELTETLLRQLIPRKIVDLDTILQTYTSGILNTSVESIKTLETVLKQLHFAKLDNSEKEKLMNSILNSQSLKDYDYLSHLTTARFLVNLTLRQWPNVDSDKHIEEKYSEKYGDIKDIYFKSILERNICMPNKNDKKHVKDMTFHMDLKTFEIFTNIVRNFVDAINSQSIELLLNVIVLLINVTNFMLKYRILEESVINSSLMMKLVERILNYGALKKFQFYQSKSDREKKRLLECVTILDKIFSYNNNCVLSSRTKEIVPFDLLKTLVGVLNDLQDEQEGTSELKFELKKALTKALSSFSCVSSTNLNQNQNNILEVLAMPNYNCNIEGDYKLLLTFLEGLKYSKTGIIPDKVLGNILKSVEEMCIARYHSSDSAVEILNTLNVLYPHFAAGSDDSDKVALVALLKPFYEKREEYGPDVSLALLNCIGQLIEVDSENKFSRWSGVNVVYHVPDFLCSDYQEIRFKAIETLVIFFRVMSKSNQLRDFHRQEEIFSKMYEKSLEVFEVSGEITQERRTDEIISRTASVLHSFSSLVLCTNCWIEESLYVLVKLTYIKNLGSVNKILDVINKYLYGEAETNCMEKYLDYLLEKWLTERRVIDNFPFKLLNCETKLEFYSKYFNTCIPLLIVTDRKDLITTAKEMGFSEKEIVQKSCAKIFGRALCDDIENMDTIMSTNKILMYYSQVVGLDGFKKILIDNLDQSLLCILRFLTDEQYILENFGETVIFSQKNMSLRQLEICLKFIESFLCDGTSIVTFLLENDLSKFEKVLLVLKTDLYSACTTENKLKSFHRYTAWINIVVNSLEVETNCQYFFIRDTIYTLINLIENHKETVSFITAVSNFTASFLKNILPKFSETFEQFLIFTVNSLKNYAVTLNVVSDKCVEILHFLIVQNACHLMKAIEKLDKFPQDPKFDSVRNVHTKIKYENAEASLEDEINFFLQHEDDSTRQDSLVHLRSLLSKEKEQLKALYEKLDNIRGFSEDCEKSSLHKLVCMLAKMSCSTNEAMRFEAIKCLGELGPSNLTTLVLQPEKEVLDIKCSPFELLTGHIISLLTEYIVDADINVAKTASEAFYLVLDSKEGRKIAGSEVNFGYGNIDRKNFAPYLPKSKSSPTSNTAVHTNLFVNKINEDKLWCGDGVICHRKWIISLVTSLLETFTNKSYLPELIPLCKVVPALCEKLLPLLVNLLLYSTDKNIHEILSLKINCFFSRHWSLTVPKYTAQNSITINKKSVKCMLDVVGFVRLQRSYAAKSKMRQSGSLELNYLKVAKAAEFCAAHFSALLYSELWCQAKIQELENCQKTADYLIGSTMLDFIYENEEECVGEALQNILRNAYKAIGDLDALPGCGVQFLLKPQFRVEHYKELGNWDQVNQFYETQISHGVKSARKDLIESLKKCSLYQLPLLCSKQTDESQYECLWRLGQWSTIDKSFDFTENSFVPEDFEKYRFYSLKALHEKNEYAYAEAKKSQALCVIEHLRHISLESSQNIYPILTQLQALNELEDFECAVKSNEFISLLNKWDLQDDLVKTNDFHYVEPIIAQRTVMLMDYLKNHQDDTLKTYLVKMLLNFADLAKREKQFNIASTSLSHLQFMSDLSDDLQMQIQLMDAQISWSLNNKLIAHHILNKLCKNESISNRLQSAALKLYGEYMSETFSESRITIITDYFLKSTKLMNNVEKNQEDCINILDTYDKLAEFADKGYQQVMTYMKSDLFQRKVINMEKSKETASKIQKQSRKTKDEFIAANIHVKQSNIDAIEIENAKQERNQFLKIALRYYFLNLKHTDKNNIKIFRIMSLLFENKNNQLVSDTQIDILPSYKYITMLPQLIPHITENDTDLYGRKVNEIVEKCAVEHPHHTLPLLLSLANAHKDREFSDSKTKTSSNDARVSTANKMIKKLKITDVLRRHINKLEQLSQALIELAYYHDSNADDKQKVFKIPRNQKIMRIQNFDDILLPTHNLPVSKTCNYSSVVGITSFGSEYHPVGGVNCPKRITCRGTDGEIRSQLLKGHDDLRQDAVMQQVFTIMNNLLATNKQTRNLLIRTYKIVPLSMRSGILQWVDNSMLIGDYLIGKDKEIGAHQIYRPNDKPPLTCKSMIRRCADKSPEERLATFKTICKIFKPVFHKFFETSFPHPTIWYERRRAYIHSVATTSMCGYILGIGDRHVSNILIDKTTAEVIHIDFGIAFEQGRVLPTPETVPFRLTRDIIDGMGVSGVEGIFRRSCEKTMEVLRQNSQTIITILEVLLYDPLYVWTVTSAEANKRQTDDENDIRNLSSEIEEENTTVNITAERALLRLKEKLQGNELGHSTSIEHQVATLIQQAVDPANLCRLFHGWQAYL
ncbi:serine-protein kinase ATM [Anoplophora glabripennis]|nr:serine-protein kinase ATM [Anoplophora glabripennis]